MEALGEDEINFLEGASFGFDVEEPDEGQEASVDDCEDEVSAPGDIGDHDWRDHDNEEVEELENH